MKMTEAELLAFLDEESEQSRDISQGQVASDRSKSMRSYLREPYGNEEEGRSAVIASDVFDAVEGMLPDLIEVFTSSDKAVVFEPVGPEDEESAEQVTNACNYVFYKQNNGFLILYTALKDALMLKTGAVKWCWEEKETPTFSTYRGVTEDQIAEYLMANPDTEVLSQEEVELEGEQLEQFQQYAAQAVQAGLPMPAMPVHYNVQAKSVQKVGKCVVVAMPPEELRVSARHDSILLDDCQYVAHVTEKTLSDIVAMGYDVTEDDVRAAADDESQWQDYSTSSYARNKWQDDNASDDSSTRGWLRDEYVLVDFDGDGIAERRRVVRLGNLILENTECSHVPIAAWTPYILTHQFNGLSVADLVEEFQRIHTTIMRQQIDNLYLANNQETVVLTDAQGNPQANIDDLLNRRPGGIIRAKSVGAVQPFMQRWQGIEAMPMLEQLQGEKENRTGWTRYSQGLDGNSLNKTATGAQMIMNASQKRMKLMARIAAECLVAPMFRGIFKTLSDHGMQKISYRLNGKFVEYDPQEWRDQYDMTINVGIGTGDVQQQSAFLMQIAQSQAAVAGSPFAAKLLSPKSVYNVQARLAENAGFKNPAEFWVDPDTVETPDAPPPPNPAVELEKAKLQDSQQKTQAEMQMKQQQSAREAAFKEHQANAEFAFKAEQAELDRQHDIYLEQMRQQSVERLKAMELMAANAAEPQQDVDALMMQMQQPFAMLANALAAPKRVVRDANGQAVGVVSELNYPNEAPQ